MDKQLRAEIVATVRQAMLTYNEKWVTADVLCEHVGSLTKRWLRDHGCEEILTKAQKIYLSDMEQEELLPLVEEWMTYRYINAL